MHWISLIGFCIIVNICQAQPSTFKNFETNNNNKGGTFQVIPNNDNVVSPGSKSAGDGSNNMLSPPPQSGNSMKYEKGGYPSGPYIYNTGNHNYCYIVLPFIIAALITMNRF